MNDNEVNGQYVRDDRRQETRLYHHSPKDDLSIQVSKTEPTIVQYWVNTRFGVSHLKSQPSDRLKHSCFANDRILSFVTFCHQNRNFMLHTSHSKNNWWASKMAQYVKALCHPAWLAEFDPGVSQGRERELGCSATSTQALLSVYTHVHQ